MANYVRLELARGRSKVPAYTPFIVPDVSAAPWDVASKEHQAAVSRWRTSARQAKLEDNTQLIPTQAWILYRLRFLIAADLAGAWSGYGGLDSQIRRLDIVIHISIADAHFDVASAYGRLVREFLAERGRSRREIG